MSFSIFELSRWGGKPVHLFRFTRGTLVWRYTSADREIVLGDETFLPAAIARGPIRESMEAAKNNLTITFPYLLNPLATDLPSTQPLGDNWRPYPPSDRITVTCMALHYGDDEAAIEWTGRVLSPSFTDTKCTLTCHPSHRSAKRSGMQRKWQRSCDVPVYSQGHGMCNVDKALHALPATVDSVFGLMVTAEAFATLPTGRLSGGFIEWTRADGLQDFRTIMAHTGDVIVVNYGASDLLEALDVVAYPGCAHNEAACAEFDNSPNHGGAKNLPNKDVMSGVPVW